MGISFGEVLVISSLVGFLIYWLHYWTVEFTYMRDKLSSVSKVHVNTEVAARTCGHLTNLLAALLMLPASRTGIWVDVFGVSYDRTIKYHRFLGILCYVTLTTHACLWWTKWLYEGNLGRNIFGFNKLYISPERVSFMDFTIPLAETAWFLLTVTLLVAYGLRRRRYDFFQYSHKIIGILFLITAILHSWSFW
jgi:predicted ferric reductase